MPSLIAYLRVLSEGVAYSLKLPDAPEGEQTGQELCTLHDGRTIVALFDGYTLPTDQPAEISASIEVLTLTPALRENIIRTSLLVQRIYADTEQRIRSVYSVSDECKWARIGVGVALGAYTFGAGEQDELLAFGAHCEACRQWGREQRAALGL